MADFVGVYGALKTSFNPLPFGLALDLLDGLRVFDWTFFG
jgi:hypothetical protein